MVDTIKCPKCEVYYSDKHDKCPNPKCSGFKVCPQCGEKPTMTEVVAGVASCKCGNSYRYSMDGKAPEVVEYKVNVDKEDGKTSVQTVVVKDINMPFESMVIFMVKWAIAAIPAFIILFIIGFFISMSLLGISIG
mgnify:CR=1 FL=1